MAETRTKASVALLVPPMRSRKEDEVRRSASSEVTAAVDASPEVPEIPEVPAVAGPAWRAGAVDDELIALYPDAACALDHDGPFQLLIATVLSAQTTDARVNTVTPELFGRYPDAAALGAARREDLEAILRPLGFQRAKAGHLLGIGQALTERFEGRVPCSREELVSLPGVGRKTANVVLNEAFGIVEGIAVDTHVFRIAHRLKFAGPSADTPAKTEAALLKLYPREYWGPINHQWVLFGRETCIARNPKCATCFLCDLCPSCGKA